MYGLENGRYIINLIKSFKRDYLFQNNRRIISDRVCRLVLDRFKSNIPEIADKAGILAFSTVPFDVGVNALRNRNYRMKYVCVIIIDDMVYDVYNDIFHIRLDDYIKLYSCKLVVNTRHSDCTLSESAIDILNKAGIITDVEQKAQEENEVGISEGVPVDDVIDVEGDESGSKEDENVEIADSNNESEEVCLEFDGGVEGNAYESVEVEAAVVVNNGEAVYV